jgi:hypothetical protein
MAGMNFRRHVALPGALVLVKGEPGAVPCEVAGESKVTEFDGELLVLKGEEYIFEFQIAVGDALGVQVVQG